MSIDTAAKRRYAVSVLPIHKVPLPTGSIGWPERVNAGWIYPLYTKPFGVYINSVKAQHRKGSLSVELRIEERSVAEFTVVDIPGTASYQKGQTVVIYEPDSSLAFAGVIDTPEKVAQSPTGGLYHPIRCADWHYLADRRLVAESYLVAGYPHAEDIVRHILTNYLASEGVTEGTIEEGPAIIEAVFNYVRVTDAFDALAEKSGKIWYIGEDKKLYFVDRDTTPASWDADAATNIDNCKWAGGNPKYRNRQYIRGGKGTTALLTETFIADGEQVAFTVSFPLAKVPFGATGSIKINEPSAALTMGIKGLDDPMDYEAYWNKGDATISLRDLPAVDDEIEVKYIGQFPILVLAEDLMAIAAQKAVEGFGTGWVDDIADEPKLTDVDASIDAAEAKLVKYAVAGQRFQYTTVETGLRPGQIQTINYATLGLINEEMLIESVILNFQVDEIFHEVVAIQGPTMGSWVDLFKALAYMKSEIIERLNVGSEQILIILARVAEDWVWDEDIDIDEFACPVPAATLYPLATLYPC